MTFRSNYKIRKISAGHYKFEGDKYNVEFKRFKTKGSKAYWGLVENTKEAKDEKNKYRILAYIKDEHFGSKKEQVKKLVGDDKFFNIVHK